MERSVENFETRGTAFVRQAVKGFLTWAAYVEITQKRNFNSKMQHDDIAITYKAALETFQRILTDLSNKDRDDGLMKENLDDLFSKNVAITRDNQ